MDRKTMTLPISILKGSIAPKDNGYYPEKITMLSVPPIGVKCIPTPVSR